MISTGLLMCMYSAGLVLLGFLLGTLVVLMMMSKRLNELDHLIAELNEAIEEDKNHE
jgi:sulfite exporter TauE/SafE